MARKFRVGERVCVGVGHSGVDSGKCGVVVDRREVRTNGRGVPTEVAGAYKPVDWKSEVAIRLDNGKLITMYKERLVGLDGRRFDGLGRVEMTDSLRKAAFMAIFAVSKSLISPTMMTSGSWRRMARSPSAKP